MHSSFIVFVVLVVIVVAVFAFRLGLKVNKDTKHELLRHKNKKTYADCFAKNIETFKYGTFTDSRDGEVYHTVQIGEQVWMVENLRFKTNDSFAPNDDESIVSKYGRLYTWTSALGISKDFSTQSLSKDLALANQVKEKNYQGIAPEGWHIPDIKEWETLMCNLDPTLKGSELRGECAWKESGKDTFGFFALPAGYHFKNGTFCHFGRRARFWSKDEYGKMNAFRFEIRDDSIDIEGVYRTDAISIRCIKNA